jgi:hypothetical protein
VGTNSTLGAMVQSLLCQQRGQSQWQPHLQRCTLGSATIFFVSSVGRASGSPTCRLCRGVQWEVSLSSLSAAWAEPVADPPAEVCNRKCHYLLCQQLGQSQWQTHLQRCAAGSTAGCGVQCGVAQMMQPQSPQQQGVACRDTPAGCQSLTPPAVVSK